MTWRYVAAVERFEGEDVWTFRELYTDSDGNVSWSKDPIAPRGSTWWELQEDLTKMGQAGPQVLDLSADPPVLNSGKPGKRQKK